MECLVECNLPASPPETQALENFLEAREREATGSTSSDCNSASDEESEGELLGPSAGTALLHSGMEEHPFFQV